MAALLSSIQAAFSSSPLSTPAKTPRLQPDTSQRGTTSKMASQMDVDSDSDREVSPSTSRASGLQEDVDSDLAEEDSPDEENAFDEDGEYEVEAIMGRRYTRDGEVEYKIRWKGYAASSDTWEPIENINAQDLVDDYEIAHPPRKKGQAAAPPSFAEKRKRKEQRREARDASAWSESTIREPSYASKSAQKSAPASYLDVAPSHSTKRSAIQPSASPPVRSPSTQRRAVSSINPDDFFFMDPVTEASEYIIPLSTVVCEKLFSALFAALSATSTRPYLQRKMFAVHPATLVKLRTPTYNTHLRELQKRALEDLLESIKGNRIPLLSNRAFSDDSVFVKKSLFDIMKGGEGYNLAWTFGLEDSDDEMAHIISSLTHIVQDVDNGKKCRLLVRRLKPNIIAACTHFRIDVVDIETFVKEIKGT